MMRAKFLWPLKKQQSYSGTANLTVLKAQDGRLQQTFTLGSTYRWLTGSKTALQSLASRLHSLFETSSQHGQPLYVNLNENLDSTSSTTQPYSLLLPNGAQAMFVALSQPDGGTLLILTPLRSDPKKDSNGRPD